MRWMVLALALISASSMRAAADQFERCALEANEAWRAARAAGRDPLMASDAANRACMARPLPSAEQAAREEERARWRAAGRVRMADRGLTLRHFIPCERWGEWAASYAHGRDVGVPLDRQLEALPRGPEADMVMVETAETMARAIYERPSLTPADSFALANDACGWPGLAPPSRR